MIKRIPVFDPSGFDNTEDIIRMQRLLAENGYSSDASDCDKLWREYSDSMAAGWLYLPETDDELWSIIWPYVEKELEND